MSANTGLRGADLAKRGIRRSSVGSSPARTAWAGFLQAAKEMAEKGSFSGFEGSVSFAERNGFFQSDAKKRLG